MGSPYIILTYWQQVKMINSQQLFRLEEPQKRVNTVHYWEILGRLVSKDGVWVNVILMRLSFK